MKLVKSEKIQLNITGNALWWQSTTSPCIVSYSLGSLTHWVMYIVYCIGKIFHTLFSRSIFLVVSMSKNNKFFFSFSSITKSTSTCCASSSMRQKIHYFHNAYIFIILLSAWCVDPLRWLYRVDDHIECVNTTKSPVNEKYKSGCLVHNWQSICCAWYSSVDLSDL